MIEIANDLVPGGVPLHAIGIEMFLPLVTPAFACTVGMGVPSPNALDVNDKWFFPPGIVSARIQEIPMSM